MQIGPETSATNQLCYNATYLEITRPFLQTRQNKHFTHVYRKESFCSNDVGRGCDIISFYITIDFYFMTKSLANSLAQCFNYISLEIGRMTILKYTPLALCTINTIIHKTKFQSSVYDQKHRIHIPFYLGGLKEIDVIALQYHTTRLVCDKNDCNYYSPSLQFLPLPPELIKLVGSFLQQPDISYTIKRHFLCTNDRRNIAAQPHNHLFEDIREIYSEIANFRTINIKLRKYVFFKWFVIYIHKEKGVFDPTIFKHDPIRSISFHRNEHSHYQTIDSNFARITLPTEYIGTSLPMGMYLMPFSFLFNGGGSLNLELFEDPYISISFTNDYNYRVTVIKSSNNVLKYSGGMVGLRYSYNY